MTDFFNDYTDLSVIERERDLPPDEPYDRLGVPDECPGCGSNDLYTDDDFQGLWVCRECGVTSDD